MSDEYTPGLVHEELVELIWANVPAWEYPTDVDRLAEAIDRYWLREHDAKVWDEGYDQGHYTPSERSGEQSPTCDCKVNPYRSEAKHE